MEIGVNFITSPATERHAVRAVRAIESAWSNSWFHVRVVRDPLGPNTVSFSPGPGRSQVRNNRRGDFFAGESNWGFAHEAGHFMWVGDGYDEETGKPLPGFENSVMGNVGSPPNNEDRHRAAQAMGCNCPCPK